MGIKRPRGTGSVRWHRGGWCGVAPRKAGAKTVYVIRDCAFYHQAEKALNDYLRVHATNG